MSSEGRGQRLNPDWWYLHGKAYDFTEFAARHPGGPHAIGLGKGRDCTALFESYHTVLPNAELLSKYEISEKTSSSYPTRIDKICFKYEKDGYYYTVKRRAREYFKANKLTHTKGTWFDIFLWMVNMVALGTTFYYGFVKGSAIAALLYGISKSLMVVESTHACSHYSFSIYPKFNRFVYWWNMCIAGDTPAQWTAKHVIAHHIDTNITPEDNDTIYPLKRVLPRYPRCWWHSYQHIYMWLFYFIIYLPWTLSHNLHVITALIRGKMIEGVVHVRQDSWFDWAETLSCIVIHHMTRLAPYFFLDTWFSAIFVAVMAELSSSMWFSLQFAVNHEIAEATVFSDLSDKVHDEGRDFGAHQLLTSHNYSMDFAPSLHLSGGLNYQIEHHLFPSVHYKYYPDLSQIVKQTAKEFNLPYNASDTFFEGVRKHYELLKEMGSKD